MCPEGFRRMAGGGGRGGGPGGGRAGQARHHHREPLGEGPDLCVLRVFSAWQEEEEEEEDPVEAALAKYGIITENPWEKGIKCASSIPPHADLLVRTLVLVR